MKKFVSQHWYRLMMGTSFLMASFGWMLHAVSPAMAGNTRENVSNVSAYKLVPVNDDGSINVRLSDEQISKIIPKNTDGSINVRMAPNATMDVNLTQIKGVEVASIRDYNKGTRGLLVGTCTGSYKCE